MKNLHRRPSKNKAKGQSHCSSLRACTSKTTHHLTLIHKPDFIMRCAHSVDTRCMPNPWSFSKWHMIRCPVIKWRKATLVPGNSQPCPGQHPNVLWEHSNLSFSGCIQYMNNMNHSRSSPQFHNPYLCYFSFPSENRNYSMVLQQSRSFSVAISHSLLV